MKLLIAIIISLIVILLAENSIRKHAPFWYWGAFALSLLCLFLPQETPAWLSSIVTGFISRGTLATALFILVMYARVLPPKSKLFGTLMSLRAPLAIMAAFMILLHNGTYFIHYHENAAKRNIAMTAPERAAAVCTTLMILLLIPLTITSFTWVRKKMKGGTWKKLQRLSYVFYGLIYTHVACLFSLQISRGNTTYQLELAIYTAIFGIYLICRVALYLKNTKKLTASNYLRKIGIPAMTVLSICIIFVNPFSIPNKNDENLADATPENNTVIEAESVALAEPKPVTPVYQDGEWQGTALGYNANITVSVTIADGMITNISVLESDDDEPYFDWATKDILPNIVNNQSVQVDSVSGATFSSEGLKDAVSDALDKALLTE